MLELIHCLGNPSRWLISNPYAWFSTACGAAMTHRHYFFCMYQQKSSASIVNSDRLVITAKGF